MKVWKAVGGEGPSGPVGCAEPSSAGVWEDKTFPGWHEVAEICVSGSSPRRHAADVLVLPQNDALGKHFLQPGRLHQHHHCFLLPLC